MKVWSVSLPTASFTVEAPAAVGASLRAFFPRAAPAAPGGAGYSLEPEGELWRLEEDGALVGRFSPVGLAMAAIADRAAEVTARSAGGATVLHAGAVDTGGSACVIAGAAETGKTATTVQLLELGHVFLADEVAVVESAGDRLHPFHRSPALGGGFVDERFGEGVPEHGELVRPAAGIVRYVPRRIGDQPVPVATLLLPRYRPGSAVEVSELAAGEALTEVLGYCFEPLGDPEALVDTLIAQLGRWSIRRFTYGDARAAAETLSALFPPPDAAGAPE